MGNLREHDVHSAVLANLGLIPGQVHWLAKSSGNSYGFYRDNRRIPASRLHVDLANAYGAVTSDRNDTILVGPNYDYDLTADPVWAKHHTHLIGAAQTPNQPRNDIWQSGTYDPMFTVSGRGCVFANLAIRHGTAATDLTAMLISGRYNLFHNVYFYTPYIATQDVAGYMGVNITGHNNYFRGCHFGSEGIARDKANCNVKIAGSGNVFENCFFSMMADGVAPFFLNLNSADDRRYTIFKGCIFYVHWANNVDQITYAITHSGAGATSNLIFDANCMFIGVDKLCASAHEAHVWVPQTYNTTDLTGGLVGINYDAD